MMVTRIHKFNTILIEYSDISSFLSSVTLTNLTFHSITGQYFIQCVGGYKLNDINDRDFHYANGYCFVFIFVTRRDTI